MSTVEVEKEEYASVKIVGGLLFGAPAAAVTGTDEGSSQWHKTKRLRASNVRTQMNLTLRAQSQSKCG